VGFGKEERSQRVKDQRQCFDTVVILTCWMLWKERNNRTFDRRVRTIHQMLDWVLEETVLWFQAP
jgi:hypothetical protein